MAHKRQHFLSRHYLRQFRIGSSERVAIATIDPVRIVGAGAISRQCQEDNFYGDDKVLEQLFAQSENDIAPVLAGLSTKLDFNGPELVALRLLVAQLHVRTRKAAESAKVFPKRIAYEVIKAAIARGDLPPPPDGKWTEDMMDFKGVPGFLFETGTIPCWLEMQTLDCKLLRATPPACFITGDNPVVLLNQFAAGADPIRSFVGFGQSGFQLLLPVAPSLCLFFYDPKVYKVGKRGKRLLDVSASDVEIINALQIQAAEKCLYFHDLSLGDDVLRMINRYAPLRSQSAKTSKNTLVGTRKSGFSTFSGHHQSFQRIGSFVAIAAASERDRAPKEMPLGRRRSPSLWRISDVILRGAGYSHASAEYSEATSPAPRATRIDHAGCAVQHCKPTLVTDLSLRSRRTIKRADNRASNYERLSPPHPTEWRDR